MHIHLEGLDLAGKSTVCRRLAARLGSPLIRRNSISDDNPVYPLVDIWRKQKAMPDETLGWLYYSVMLADFSLYVRPDGCAIQDSTILLRSLAFHEVRGSDHRLVELFRDALTRHPRYTATFLLKPSHERRLARLAIRRKENLAPEDFLVRDDPELFYRMEDTLFQYAHRHFHATIIDTTELEDETESDRIITEIIERARSAATSDRSSGP